MVKYIIVFILFLLGTYNILGVTFKKPDIKGAVNKAEQKLHEAISSKGKTLKWYVAELNGRQKDNYIKKNMKNAYEALEKTGQSEKYNSIVKFSGICAACGAACGLLMKNIPLAVVLGAGLYFLPLWCTQFYVFSYNKYLNEELEIALSQITTSYTRNNNLLKSVEENIPHINKPVKDVFITFVNNVKYVNSNIPSEIEKMKTQIDSKLFMQWCDNLILCQEDYTLRDTLIPTVDSFSDLRAQQAENETNMMLPLKEAITMILIVLLCIPLLYFINKEWFFNLIGTLPGQIILSVTMVIVFVTINKAIRLSKPIEYDV
jgi:hypothetical protein